MKNDLCKKSSRTAAKNIVKVFPGPKMIARGVVQEVESFNKLVTADMIDEIVYYTNMYIERKRLEISYSRERDVKKTSRSEICALLGALFLIGVKGGNHTNVQDLWCNDGTGMAILRACMSYKRFLFLLRSIRFDDKETREMRRSTDKLAAIRVFVDQFVGNCMGTYNLGEFVTIDEK